MKSVQVVVRIPQDLAEALDDLQPYVEWLHRGRSVGRGRSVALREALLLGVSELETMQQRDERLHRWPET